MNYSKWLEARKLGLGASDAASIIGMNPWKTNVELWEEKTGVIVPDDISDKSVVKYGNEAEPLLRELFILDHPHFNVEYEEYKIFKHSEYPFLMATLDGWIKGERMGVLEIKTTQIRNSSQWSQWKDGIPQNYYCQCLWQLLVTGFDFVILKAQIKHGVDDLKLTTNHYQIERKNVLEDIEYIKEAGVEFWNKNVLEGVRPNLILPSI